jgi:hypothetical protein
VREGEIFEESSLTFSLREQRALAQQRTSGRAQQRQMMVLRNAAAQAAAGQQQEQEREELQRRMNAEVVKLDELSKRPSTDEADRCGAHGEDEVGEGRALGRGPAAPERGKADVADSGQRMSWGPPDRASMLPPRTFPPCRT